MKLKFRQKIEGVYVYLEPKVTIDGDIVLVEKDSDPRYIDTYFEGHPMPVLEQFTGEYDDQGNEIYEIVD